MPKTSPEKLAYIYAWRARNRDKVTGYLRTWRRRNPENIAAKNCRVRARDLGVGSFTAAEWREKKALLGNVCFYCGEAKPLEADHKIPLARGGSNRIDNIVPACLSCSRRKATRTAREFLVVA